MHSASAPVKHPAIVVAVLAYCSGMVSVLQTITLPLLGVLPGILNTSVANVSWLATGVLLASAVVNPVAGRLGDMYGRRRILVYSLGVMVVGSIGSAVAPNIGALIATRVVTGLSLGSVALTMAIAKEVLPAAKLSRSLSLISATMGFGTGLSLPLAGTLLDAWGWRSVFWCVAVLGAVGMVAVHLLVPPTGTGPKQPFDVIGAVILSVALVCLLLPLSKSATWGFVKPLPLGVYAAGLVTLLLWYVYEQRPPAPLVQLSLLRGKSFKVLYAANLLLGFAMFSNMIGSIILLQLPKAVSHGFGASAMKAGLVCLPGAMVMMLAAPLSGRMSERFGARTTVWVGAIGISLAFVIRLFLLDSVLAIGIGIALVNFGIGFAWGAVPELMMSYAPITEAGSINALGSLMRSVGSAASSTALAALITGLTVTVGTKQLPALSGFEIGFVLSAVAALASGALVYTLRAIPRTAH